MPIGYPIAPEDHPNEREHRQEIARSARLAMQGHTNNILEFNLDVSPATSTTVTSPLIHPGSMFLIHPLDAAGATDYAAGNISILEADIGVETATVSHVANASARKLRVAVFG